MLSWTPAATPVKTVFVISLRGERQAARHLSAGCGACRWSGATVDWNIFQGFSSSALKCPPEGLIGRPSVRGVFFLFPKETQESCFLLPVRRRRHWTVPTVLESSRLPVPVMKPLCAARNAGGASPCGSLSPKRTTLWSAFLKTSMWIASSYCGHQGTARLCRESIAKALPALYALRGGTGVRVKPLRERRKSAARCSL